MIEIDDFKGFEDWLVSNNTVLVKRAIQDIDLSDFESLIMSKEFPDSVFLGCKASKLIAGHIVATGGIFIPQSKKLLFKSHLPFLYTADQLFKGFSLGNNTSYKDTYDYKIYAQYMEQGRDHPKSIYVSLMRRLHDHSITDSLEEAIEGRKVLAIMGGHGMERSDSDYYKIARIARRLTQKGFLIISGGGPGAMEASHLGAYFACLSDADLDTAISILKIRPLGAEKAKEYADKDWLDRAWRVKEMFPLSPKQLKESMSIGIPTWLYGHEPPAIFASHIAKYFANSVREDGLLSIAVNGVIFAAGSAGTIQEIFQDACQNHYAAYNSAKQKQYVSPMILMGKKHWTKNAPVWDLLSSVAKDRPYSSILSLLDEEDEIINELLNYKMDDYAFPKD